MDFSWNIYQMHCVYWLGIMEYETYDTDATYDDMNEGNKEKVWKITRKLKLAYLPFGGNIRYHLFLFQKVIAARTTTSGESNVGKENWVKSQTF